jgi:hypothetical protein
MQVPSVPSARQSWAPLAPLGQVHATDAPGVQRVGAEHDGASPKDPKTITAKAIERIMAPA